MGLIDNARHWAEHEASDAEKEALDAVLNPRGGLLAKLSSVTLTGMQMEAAIAAIEHIPIRGESDVSAHTEILASFARDQKLAPADYAAAALHARVIALDVWCNLHDPLGLTDRSAVMTAAGRAPLNETGNGLEFEPLAFGELVAFVTELPF